MSNTIISEMGDDLRVRLENFLKILHKDPKPEELQNTPDGKAYHYPISYVEMALDETFFGLWSTENFRWSAIQNEVQGAIDLTIIHPVLGIPLTRTGAASVQIMVDAVPDEIKENKQARNNWAISVENKKPNALDLGFPKLKAECVKNAAISLGKAFGRDVNRKHADVFKPIISGSEQGMKRAIESAITAGRFDSARMLISSSRLPDEIKLQLTEKIPA